MCAVSWLHDYGSSLPNKFWTPDTLFEFTKMLDHAETFDRRTGQANCKDPKKGAWVEEVRKRVRK